MVRFGLVCKGRLNADLDLCVVGRGMKDPCTVGHVFSTRVSLCIEKWCGDKSSDEQPSLSRCSKFVANVGHIMMGLL